MKSYKIALVILGKYLLIVSLLMLYGCAAISQKTETIIAHGGEKVILTRDVKAEAMVPDSNGHLVRSMISLPIGSIVMIGEPQAPKLETVTK